MNTPIFRGDYRPAHVVLRNFWSENAVQGQFHEYQKSVAKQLGC